jgi:hypothetical protein
MRYRADPADALHNLVGIERIPTLQKHFKASEHFPAAEGLYHLI